MNDTVLRSSRVVKGRALVAEEGRPVLSTCLPREPASVPVSRRLVRDTLTDWQLPDLVDTAELVVAELVSNSVRHARHAVIRVTMRRIAGGVRVAVMDKSQVMPMVKPQHDEAVDGRGLAIVDAVSRQWGTELLPWGKRVWADLEAPQQSAPPASRQAQLIYVLIVLAVAAFVVSAIAGQR